MIKGRRWRVSDPALDEPIRQHLVDELMDARRSVKAASNRADEEAISAARRRVHDAKVALGERGPRWWEPMNDDDARVRAAALVRSIGDRIGGVDESQALAHLRLQQPN